MTTELERLRARVAAASRGPGIASTDKKRLRKTRAIHRFDELVGGSGMTQREFAEVIECDESAVRRARESGLSLPLPTWIEALVEKRPDLVLSFIRSLLADVEDVRKAG